MTESAFAILSALRQYGTTKTLNEILDDVGAPPDKNIRVEIVNTLESSGYIQNVQYQLPLMIRGELSPKGLEALNACDVARFDADT